MKKIFYTISFILTAMVVPTSCSDFLDSENIYGKDLNNYYSTPTEINEALTGIYNPIYVDDVKGEESVIANLMDDLMLAGGGDDDIAAKDIDAFSQRQENVHKSLWTSTYKGVYRCNALIEATLGKDYSKYFSTEEEEKAFKGQVLGEAYFMRGFYLFRAARFFGGLPLIIKTDTPRNIARASIEETYAQIINDFKLAIEQFPDKKASEYTLQDFGHANKWIAEGYMGRAYLYFTGYMTNIMKQPTTDVVLPEEGGTVNKQMVIDWITDCMNNSGYAMLDDFRNLWPYAYVNERAEKYTENTSTVLPWADANNLKWAGQDGIHATYGTGNPEIMFSECHAFGSWDNGGTQWVSNRMCLYFGIRDNTLTPFHQGWGWGTVNPAFYNDWDDNDLRKEGSVLKMNDPQNGTQNFEYKTGDHHTGFVNKKYLSIVHNGPKEVRGMFAYMYGSDTDFQNWNAQDFYYMRFSDILLMHSELTETATGMNKVRQRAGLSTIDYSLDALKKERMYEFAFEAIRWFDLVRWGDVETTNNYYSRTIKVVNGGRNEEYKVTYRPETKGLVAIPEDELRLSNGVYKQNEGWK